MEIIVDFLKQFGPLGLFIHSMIDAIIFPIPAFFLQVSLSLIDPSAAIWLATVGYIGCLIGTPFGYLIGRASGALVLSKILKQESVDKAKAMFKKSGEAAILIGAFTPIPFKVFTILSGCFNFPLWKLMVYAAIGRAVKFYLVGALFYLYGRAAEHLINEYFTLISLVLTAIVLVVWFIVQKIRNRRNKRKQQQQVENS